MGDSRFEKVLGDHAKGRRAVAGVVTGQAGLIPNGSVNDR